MFRVYLDANATTRPDPLAVEAMMPHLTCGFGNPSSAHAFGREAAAALEAARAQVLALLGAAPDGGVVFTSGGTEADATAIMSAVAAREGRDEIVTTAVEHPAVLALCQWLRRNRGVRVRVVPVDARGRLDEDAWCRALGPRTAVASAMWANNETGTVFPVGRLAEAARAAGALFHTDAVQAAGRLPIRLEGTEIDMLSLSGHKFHGVKGTGALWVRRGIRLRPPSVAPSRT